MDQQKYLHDFECYSEQSEPLCNGAAQLYTRSTKQAAAITDIRATTEQEFTAIVQEAEHKAGAIPIILAITSRTSPALPFVQRYTPYPPCVTVALTLGDLLTGAPPPLPNKFRITLCDKQKLLDQRADIADLLHQSIEGARSKRLIHEECDAHKTVEVYEEELKRYAMHLHFEAAWCAYEGERLVGFSMCTKRPDDIEDTLGIGVYALWEKDLTPVWENLLWTARERLKQNNLEVQITTWEGTAAHYRNRGFKTLNTYEIRQIR